MRDVMLERQEVWVAEIEARVVAMMALAQDMVSQLYVLPDFQGCGIGGRLLAEAKRRRPRGLRLFTFQSNIRARRFYEARGFTAIAFTDGAENEERAPDVLYEWTGRENA